MSNMSSKPKTPVGVQMNANKTTQVRPPDTKPEGAKMYSDAKPVNSGSWKSNDERAMIWQMIAEIEKAILIGKADSDSKSGRKNMCDRIYAAVDEIKKTC